jgi:hypothetical protein
MDYMQLYPRKQNPSMLSFSVIRLRNTRMRRAQHEASTGEMGNAYTVSLGKRHGKRPGVYSTMILTWILIIKQ